MGLSVNKIEGSGRREKKSNRIEKKSSTMRFVSSLRASTNQNSWVLRVWSPCNKIFFFLRIITARRINLLCCPLYLYIYHVRYELLRRAVKRQIQKCLGVGSAPV